MYTHRSKTAWTLLSSLLVLSMLVASFSIAGAVQIGNDTINFIAVRYNYPTQGESTWYYEVISGRRPAISHVTFSLNLQCLQITDAGSWNGTDQNTLTPNGGIPVIGADPTTSITGLKFDEGFEEGETRYYYFTVDGNYTADDNVVVASKGGPGYDTGMITGPNGNCTVQGNPGLDLEKLVNDADADEAPGLALTEGDAVEFKFVVTNTGNVTLMNISVTDDIYGDICTITSLEAGASTSCSINDTADLGLHTNIAVASSTYGGLPIQDSDPANYTAAPIFVANPSIDIEKFVNSDDADEAPGPEVLEGSTVAFEFKVTNTGNVDLAEVTVTDDILGAICSFGPLAAGADYTCTANAAAGVGLHTNIATAAAVYNNQPVSDSDPANYTGVPKFIPNPGLNIEKLVNGEDADEAPGPEVLEGSTVTFEYIVTNTGNVALENIEVFDDQLGPICIIAGLTPGQTESCSATDAAVLGPYRNIGKARAGYEGDFYHDSDLGHYTGKPNFVPTPAIDIEKYVNGQDADTAPGPNLIVGSTATFTYVVTNTGNVPLTNILVSDNVLGKICILAGLAPGQSVTCTKTSIVILGQYGNIGKAATWYGDPKTTGIKVNDHDVAYYFGIPK